ncbi:MAG TPA: NgoFVII family restriction endonuclease [Rhodothermales bacterium]|nr:NgoFVII family restriction endonuclease [Rhodothermales bacterium]
MPRIFDNIEERLLPALQHTLTESVRADLCVGYFNLRGWSELCDHVNHFAGEDDKVCRVLVGMHRSESDELRRALRFGDAERLDNGVASRLKKELAQEFRDQLVWGAPSNEDERVLQRLATQIREGRVRVKLFLRHTLHAKLYLCFPNTFNQPAIGFLGSSNLTFSGLSHQGELNVDVKDDDACRKLAEWFEARWDDRWCVDVSDDLVTAIEESWARTEAIPPYHIYLKIARHLADDAVKGLTEFNLPKDLKGVLFDYQEAAVKLAARHLHERGGVVIGDVVGLGKTLMATALARMLEEDLDYETLILAPKNLVGMWEDYVHDYGLRRCKVLSVTRVQHELPDLRRYRLVLIDESHNLRNREGKRYRVIRDYVQRNDSKCILLTATPYNKTYYDLSNQLRLFLDDQVDLGIRPEALLREIDEVEFSRKYEASPRSIAAFEKSEHPDDWRELMRLFLVRRTRSFVKEHYALAECAACETALPAEAAKCPACGRTPDGTERRYLRFPDGTRSYFPVRIPRTVTFSTGDPEDPYARLYADHVVETIKGLKLPRYGLGTYVHPSPKEAPTPAEQQQLDDLGRAGRRLMGFCKTNLFKRLESSGEAFLRSVERHALRNLVFVHALESGQPIPIGPQDAAMLDPDLEDEDRELDPNLFDDPDVEADAEDDPPPDEDAADGLHSEVSLREAAARVYTLYQTQYARRFRWLRPGLFRRGLKKNLLEDARALIELLDTAGDWRADRDAKLAALLRLLTETHPDDKVLVFSQFADTVRYLGRALKAAGVEHVAMATGTTDDPTALAHRFSPRSNGKEIAVDRELRVLLATDVLSEGQNLQDAHIVVNFDLPWALIRLVQRAGRVDRIGQKASGILCYSFLPAEGVEKIIKLRERVSERLEENAEVVGSDEQFFEDGQAHDDLRDLYAGKPGVLDGGDAEGEVDLASQAYSIWQNAIKQTPSLKKTIEEMPGVVYSTKAQATTAVGPEGVLAYIRTAQGTDALAWLDREGNSVTESPLAILKAAECDPDTPSLERLPEHHALVTRSVQLVHREGRRLGGQLGSRRGARFRTYERLKGYIEANPLFATDALKRALQALYAYPLTETATDTLNRQLRAGLEDDALADLIVSIHDDERLVVAHDGGPDAEPQIICSLGLAHAHA